MKSIKGYEYFDYSVHEALFCSKKEETTIDDILQNIQQEYHSNINKFSQNLIVAQLEVLLTYAERFYHRQFISQKISNHKILSRLEDVLIKHLVFVILILLPVIGTRRNCIFFIGETRVLV